MKVANAANGHATLEEIYYTAADINNDGIIDVADYSSIVNKSLT